MALNITETFQRAVTLHEQGQIDQAAALYREVLHTQPLHVDALHFLGVTALQMGNGVHGADLIGKSLAIDPNQAMAQMNLGNALSDLGKPAEALASFDRAIRLDPELALAFYGRGNALRDLGRLEEALRSYDSAIQIEDRFLVAFANRGNVLLDLKCPAEALLSFELALSLDPESADMHNNRGTALRDLQRFDEALASFDQALRLQPRYVEALNNRGTVLLERDRLEAALASYALAVELAPYVAEGWNNQGNVLARLKRQDEALSSFDRAIRLQPEYADAYFNRGNTLHELKRFQQAANDFDRSLQLNPRKIEALTGRGNVSRDLGRLTEAVSFYDRALQLDPRDAITINNRAMAFMQLQRYDEAAAGFVKLLEVAPDFDDAKGHLLHSRLQYCDWIGHTALVEQIHSEVRAGRRADSPFAQLAHTEDPALQAQCARTYVAQVYAPQPAPLWKGERYKHDKIRVAYLSADFLDHAVPHLLVGVLERHDRTRFETIAISLQPEAQPSAMGQRLRRAFSQFHDAHELNDAAVAQLLRNLEVDIAIDLNGHTSFARPRILAHRPAPVQVNYLGYPATMGAEWLDYLIADSVIIPTEHEPHYVEKIVRLPHTYLPSDNQLSIATEKPSRQSAGLPADGFVFCAFHSGYKILPAMFDVWMRILQQVPGSVLWLRALQPAAEANLRREAVVRGIAAERLIFAPLLPDMSEHLSRYRLADLFLDTLPYNGHTTLCDVLWTGLPALSCLGTTFAGRVGTSLLRAIGLPELATANLADYETMAVRLATHPEALADLRTKLATHRETHPLFDTDRFRRDLERAYIAVWERQQRGEAPASFNLPVA